MEKEPIDWRRVRVDEILKRYRRGDDLTDEEKRIIESLVTCPVCNKSGYVGGQQCANCDGAGAIPPKS